MRLSAAYLILSACRAPTPTPTPAPTPTPTAAEALPPAPVEAAPIAVVDAGAPAPVASGEAPTELLDLVDRPLGEGSTWSEEVTLRNGQTRVTGNLPPEVIQRIVRQSFGRVRHCVTRGTPHRTVRITATFTIAPSGALFGKPSATSEPGDPKLSACVAKQLADLSFPQPEGGKVVVVYPIIATREVVPKP